MLEEYLYALHIDRNGDDKAKLRAHNQKLEREVS
jgi:hypothetical protein